MQETLFHIIYSLYHDLVLSFSKLIYKNNKKKIKHSVMPILNERIDPFRDFLLCNNTNNILEAQNNYCLFNTTIYSDLQDRRNGLLLLKNSSVSEQMTYNKRASELCSHSFETQMDYIQYNIDIMNKIIQRIENMEYNMDITPCSEYNYAIQNNRSDQTI